jgi:hypothetical protein
MRLFGMQFWRFPPLHVSSACLSACSKTRMDQPLEHERLHRQAALDPVQDFLLPRATPHTFDLREALSRSFLRPRTLPYYPGQKPSPRTEAGLPWEARRDML